jgi:cell division protein FtsL
MERLATQVSHGFRRKGLDLSPRVIVLFMVLIAVVLALATVRVYLTARVIVSARQLQDMRAEYTGLQRENAVLELGVADHQTVPVVLERAAGMGLQLPDEFEVIDR